MKLRPLLFAAPLVVLGAGVLAQVGERDDAQADSDEAAAPAPREELSHGVIAARDPSSSVRFHAQKGDFIAARTALGRIDDHDERAEMKRVLDELELAAICDQALELLDQRQAQAAQSLLRSAMLRMESAQDAQVRARALAHLADALSRGEPPTNNFLEELEEAEASADEREQKRQSNIEKQREFIQEMLVEGARLTDLAVEAVVDGRTTVVQNSAAQAREAFAAARESFALLKRYLDAEEWQDEFADYESRELDMQDSLSIALGTVFYNNESFGAAQKEVEEALIRNPDDPDLLELLVRIRDQWRYHRSE